MLPDNAGSGQLPELLRPLAGVKAKVCFGRPFRHSFLAIIWPSVRRTGGATHCADFQIIADGQGGAN